MRSVIEQTNGAWHEALRDILFESSLMQMAVWIVGLLFAMTAVFAAQGLSRYVAVRCAEIVETMRSKQNSGVDEINQALETVGVQYILAKVAMCQSRST